jgi:hypothetical protein
LSGSAIEVSAAPPGISLVIHLRASMENATFRFQMDYLFAVSCSWEILGYALADPLRLLRPNWNF